MLPLVRLFCRPLSIEGEEAMAHLDGPVVFVANHASHADTAVMQTVCNRRRRGRMVALAAEDHFFSGPVLSAVSTLLVGAVPFPRRGPVGLARAFQALDLGYDVLMFPQGTRSGGPFRKGVGALASEGATLIPVGIVGTGEVLPPRRILPRRGGVSVRFGRPMSLAGSDPGEAAAALEEAVRQLTVPASGSGRRDSQGR